MVNIFSGINKRRVIKTIDINDFITEYIQSEVIETITRLARTADISYEEKKKCLPLFNVSAVFNGKGIRNSNIIGYTGYLGVDIDKKDNEGKELKINNFNLNYVLYAFYSFGGGIRLIVKLSDDITSKLNAGSIEFQKVAKSIIADIEENTGYKVDKSCIDATRRFFLNYSEEVFENKNVEGFKNLKAEKKEEVAISDSEILKSSVKPVDKKAKNFREDIDIERVKLPTGVRYEGRYYLNVLPLGTFYLPKKPKSIKVLDGKVVKFEGDKIKVGKRNNALCRYLLNYIAYKVWLNRSLSIDELASQADYFNSVFLEESLPEKQINATVKSMYKSFVQKRYTKEYLVSVFGVKYAKETETYSDYLYAKKVRKFLLAIKKFDKTPTFKEVALKLNKSTKYVQRLLNEIIERNNLTLTAKELLNRFIEIIASTANDIINKVFKAIEEALDKSKKFVLNFIESVIYGVDIGFVTWEIVVL